MIRPELTRIRATEHYTPTYQEAMK